MQDTVSPKKKKKSSFLDDDDFFVMKRSKKSKYKPQQETAQQETTKHASTSYPKELTSQLCHDSALTPSGSVSPSSDKAAFFSATETFSDPMPIDLASLGRESQIGAGVIDEPEVITIEAADNKPRDTDAYETRNPAENVRATTYSEETIGSEEEDSDLRSFFKNVTSSRSTNSDEANRRYIVKVTSKLGFHVEYEKQVIGDTTFEELLRILSRDTLRDYGVSDYWSHGVLVWVEGKSELKPIFKPSTLRIPPKEGEISKISCLYIPREHLASFDKLYEEFGTVSEPVDEEDHPTIYSLSDTEVDVPEAPKSDYFIIGLKDKDNKRVEVEVGPTTKISSILKYYLQVKGIKNVPVEKCKLLFDDEELALDSVVGDSELEEDFELQVYVN